MSVLRSSEASVTTERMIYQVPATREHIIDVAADVFAERGFFSVKMTDIAAAAGISRTSLYRYFQDKLDIGLAVSERLIASLPVASPQWRADLQARSTTGLDEFGRYLDAMWVSNRLDREERFFAEFDTYFSGDRAPDDFRERFEGVLESAPLPVHSLSAVIERGIADGSVRPDIDPQVVIAASTNAMRGLKHRLLLKGEALVEMRGVDPGEVMRAMKDLIIQGLRGNETT